MPGGGKATEACAENCNVHRASSIGDKRFYVKDTGNLNGDAKVFLEEAYSKNEKILYLEI